MQWYPKVLSQYAKFAGRARRTEYWMFVLFSVIVQIVLVLLDNLLGLMLEPNLGLLSTIYMLATLLPTLGVSVRRLHDTGRSGWWVLIGFVPLVGAIVLIVFFATEGNRGLNSHGADPKATQSDPATA